MDFIAGYRFMLRNIVYGRETLFLRQKYELETLSLSPQQRTSFIENVELEILRCINFIRIIITRAVPINEIRLSIL